MSKLIRKMIPRILKICIDLLGFHTSETFIVHYWLFILFAGTILIFFFLSTELGNLVKVATVLSFLTAPFYAILNYKLMCSIKV